MIRHLVFATFLSSILCLHAAESAPMVSPTPLNREAHFLMGLPKAEMHIHLEGTLEPATVIELAARNGLADFPFKTIPEIEQRLGDAKDLPTFIQVYEQLLSVLRTEDDFYEAAMRYFRRARAQNVLYVELFFDPQMHTTRGVKMETIMAGLRRARLDAEKLLDLRASYILCFNRDRTAESAMQHLEMALPYRDIIIGIGTDNPEQSGFPEKFAAVYARAREAGFRLTSHCDVDIPGSVGNIRGCFDLLGVERIDHGVNVLDDPGLLATAKERGIGFTVCPAILLGKTAGAYNFHYFDRCALAAEKMLDAGLLVTLGSDDPGIMANQHLGDVYIATQQLLGLSREKMTTFARNGFQMAWLKPEEKAAYLGKIDAYVKNFPSEKKTP